MLTPIDHFAIGAVFGLFLSWCASQKEKLRLWAPLLIVLCGAWSVLPYIMSEIPMFPRKAAESPLFNIFFFYPALHIVSFPKQNSLSLFVLWLIYIYICVYYISYIKELIKYKESLSQDAK